MNERTSKYADKKNYKVKVYNEADKARESASNFSKTLSYNIPYPTYYLFVASDNHNKTEALIDYLTAASYLDNAGVVFLGDQANVAIPGSKTQMHEAKPLQVEVDSIAYAIEKSGINIEKQVKAYIDGNHEAREPKNTSLEIGKSITAALGIEDRFCQNAALLSLVFNNPIKQGAYVPVTTFLSHGQGRGGGQGAEADKSLNSNFAKGVRITIQGDTHKVICANKKFIEYDPGNKNPVTKEKLFANFGTDLSAEEYLMEKGLPIRAVRDGEVLKISVLPNKDKTDVDVVVDFVNVRQILLENVKRLADNVKDKLSMIESRNFKSLQEVDNAYRAILKYTQQKMSILKTEPIVRASRYPKTLRIVPLAGMNIGSKESENSTEIDEMIQTLATLDDSCKVILNGDMIYYKKANLLHQINYPEDTFAYLQTLAQKLEPIKDKIIAYNSGINEADVMKNVGNASKHAYELAEIAMKTIQLDENLAFEPMSKKAIAIEAKKQQNAQVSQRNEDVLAKEYHKYDMNLRKLAELAKYKKNIIDGIEGPITKEELKASENWNKQELEYLLVLKLRKEGILLDYSTPEGKKKINRLFPLEDFKLREPHHNLIQNILCRLLEIDPKTIAMNSNLNESCQNFIKILNEKNEVKGLNIITTYKKIRATSKAGTSRKAIEGQLKGNHNGADIYISNGQEYATKERELIVDSYGTRHVYDILHISGGRLDIPSSSNKIYEVRCEKSSRERIAGGMFEDTDDLTLTWSTVDYKSISYDTYAKDIQGIFKKLLVDSKQKSETKVKTMLAMEEKQVYEKKLDKIFEQTMKIKKPKAPIKPKTSAKTQDGGKE